MTYSHKHWQIGIFKSSYHECAYVKRRRLPSFQDWRIGWSKTPHAVYPFALRVLMCWICALLLGLNLNLSDSWLPSGSIQIPLGQGFVPYLNSLAHSLRLEKEENSR